MTNQKPEIKPRATINKIPVWCAHDKIVDCVELVMNPKNPNTHDKVFADFHNAIIDEIWNSQDLAEGFKGTPGDNKRKFRGQFPNRQGSILDDIETDARDLI